MSTARGGVQLRAGGSQAMVSQPDLFVCNNGVVHVIDALLVPSRTGIAAAPSAGMQGAGMQGTAAPAAGAGTVATGGAGGVATGGTGGAATDGTGGAAPDGAGGAAPGGAGATTTGSAPLGG